MVIVGIDPGKNGAIAVLRDNGAIEVSKIYNKDDTLRYSFIELMRKLDTLVIKKTFDSRNLKVYLELVNGVPSWGYKNFGFGKTFGGMTHILAILKLPYEFVSAKKWSKKVHDSKCKKLKRLNKDLTDKEKREIEKIRYKAKKDANRALAKRLFPKFGYLLDVKGNDGIADALLIMEYGIREIGLRAHTEILTEGVDAAQEDIFK